MSMGSFSYDGKRYNVSSLEEKLNIVRENLQIKFYDEVNMRKPTICTADVIASLVRYKPRSLQDMSNIRGIGPVFIENYGQYFIDVIIADNPRPCIPTTPKEKETLSKLENRLVNVNKRNRLLYSAKVNKDYGIDLFNVLEKDINKFENFLINQEQKSYKLLDVDDYEDKQFKTISKLMRQVAKIEMETGNNELYVAYPFAQGRATSEDFDFKSPLILFPVTLEKEDTKIILKNDETRDIVYNTTLILANNKFNRENLVLPDKAVDEFSPINFINDMKLFYQKNNLFLGNVSSNIEAFLENTVNTFPKYRNGEIEVKRYMVLGIYTPYTTSLYADFHKMVESNSTTDLVKELISEDYDNGTSNSYDENEVKLSTMDKVEGEINYINELDFSQEKVMKAVKDYKALVVQGPPGTGKSQTITSIISQAILQQKTVLMVSEKKTALDVIYSRLGHLSDFALIIDDIKNKDAFYKQLHGIIETGFANYGEQSFAYNEQSLINDIKLQISAIDNKIDKLNQISKLVYGSCNFGISMEYVYNKCKRIETGESEEARKLAYLSREYNGVFEQIRYDKLLECINQLNDDNIYKAYLEIEYDKNNYKDFLSIRDNLSQIDLMNLNKDLDDMINVIEEYKRFNFLKKLFRKKNVAQTVETVYKQYFTRQYYDAVGTSFVANVDKVREFTNRYEDYETSLPIVNSLDDETKCYFDKTMSFAKNFEMEVFEANQEMLNFILNVRINNFEKNNRQVLTYINDFDKIRENIKININAKKDTTRKLAYLYLKQNILNLDSNRNLKKIEEMCDKKRKVSVNKFMSRFKLEMLDSVKIWLMTPEVVADILPFDKDVIDLVIFDEASQLYVEKAIPAIYRAKRVVVAGDNKQLKPSSLGKGRILDDIDEDEIDDTFLEYESLLDAAHYKYYHTMLNYHYRSKYEELIAFSNYAFYGGKLLVTSDAKPGNGKVIERIKVEDGRWINKQNIKEAEQVVKTVKDILMNRTHEETLGVITFNASQMNLIEDLIDKEKVSDPVFASIMSEEEHRYNNGENISFFVKNIESVQGDERDIIIFCVGYAQNENNRVSVNFGWLNIDGGENRLNVAISRAKKKIYVVTSIEPEELVVDSTKNNGPKLFKKYLEYVRAIDQDNKEVAKNILYSLLDRPVNSRTTAVFDSEFEEEVFNKLQEAGLEVETQYGVGGYRIDLVIQNKEHTKNILGIECDGRLYHSSRFARERDYHRQKYLESRGWKIYRIWSTNWWRNPDLEIEKIVNLVKSLNSFNSSIDDLNYTKESHELKMDLSAPTKVDKKEILIKQAEIKPNKVAISQDNIERKVLIGTVTGVAKAMSSSNNEVSLSEFFYKNEGENAFIDAEHENIDPRVIGPLVENLTSIELGFDKKMIFKNALSVSINPLVNLYDDAYINLENLKPGLDYDSVCCALYLTLLDSLYKAGQNNIESFKKALTETPDIITYQHVKTMVNRSVAFFNRVGPVKNCKLGFDGAYTSQIKKGEIDYITNDTIWDMKVLKGKPNKDHILQLMIYYAMGKHSTIIEYSTVKNIGIYNPRLNESYIRDYECISLEARHHVERHIIGYED